MLLTSPTDASTCADNTIENGASVTTSNDGSASTDPQDPATITVQCADIGIDKTTDTPEVTAGDQVRYTITVTNDGDGDAHDVTVTDTLPTNPGLVWTATPSQGSCSSTAPDGPRR